MATLPVSGEQVLPILTRLWYTVPMPAIPKTSVSLLEALSGDASSVRWTEFYNKYEGPMRAFLQARFPTVEADDVIQETLIALVKCLPNYRYVPDEHGYFHNYLMGIVKHKALDIVRRQAARSVIRSQLEKEEQERMKRFQEPRDEAEEEAAWQNAVKEAALEQLLADDSISLATREVFRHVALMHEPPMKVASQFGITRNNVDQIKARLIARLKEIIADMTAAMD